MFRFVCYKKQYLFLFLFLFLLFLSFCLYQSIVYGREVLEEPYVDPLCIRRNIQGKSKENYCYSFLFFVTDFFTKAFSPKLTPSFRLIYIWKGLKEPPLYYIVAKWNTTTEYIYQELSCADFLESPKIEMV